MKKLSNDEKLKIVTDFLVSKQWDWLKDEYETRAKMLEPTAHTRIENKEDFIYKQGVLAGVRWCISRPDEVKRDSEAFLNRMIAAIGGK